MNLLNTSSDRVRVKETQAMHAPAQRPVDYVRPHGLVETIDLDFQRPLATSSYLPVINVGKARDGS